jgi:hypothetical protein
MGPRYFNISIPVLEVLAATLNLRITRFAIQCLNFWTTVSYTSTLHYEVLDKLLILSS